MIAEDLLLLVTDDSTGKAHGDSGSLDYGLAGAVLCELAIARRIRLTTDSDFHHKKNRVVVESTAPTGDPTLDNALSLLAQKERKPYDAIQALKKGLRSALYLRLAEEGVLRFEVRRVLGIIPRSVWPTVNPAHETELRRTLERTLIRGTSPDAHTEALIGCLSAVGMAHQVVPTADRSALKSTAKEYRQRNWGAKAARDAYEADASSSAAVMG